MDMYICEASINPEGFLLYISNLHLQQHGFYLRFISKNFFYSMCEA